MRRTAQPIYLTRTRTTFITGIIYTNPLPGIVRADTQAVYAFDTLKLHPKFELSGGLRYERYHANGDLPPTITLPTA